MFLLRCSMIISLEFLLNLGLHIIGRYRIIRLYRVWSAYFSAVKGHGTVTVLGLQIFRSSRQGPTCVQIATILLNPIFPRYRFGFTLSRRFEAGG